jgi:Bacterial sugar transferase
MKQLTRFAMGGRLAHRRRFVAITKGQFEAASLDRWQHQRHQMKPGITGLWQISAGATSEWNVRMWFDHPYIHEWSLALDLKVLARSPTAVACGAAALVTQSRARAKATAARAGHGGSQAQHTTTIAAAAKSPSTSIGASG